MSYYPSTITTHGTYSAIKQPERLPNEDNMKVITKSVDLFKDIFKHLDETQEKELILQIYDYLTSEHNIQKEDLTIQILDALDVRRNCSFLDSLNSITDN